MPPGITLEFKESDEYKELARQVRALDSSLPDYLVAMALAFHKMNPRAYKEYAQATRAEKKANKGKPAPQHFTLDAVSVYADPADAPPVTPVRLAGEPEKLAVDN